MARVTLGGNPVQTGGELPQKGAIAPAFTLTRSDFSSASLSDYAGKNVILNIFPSIDTSTCATSVRKFNEKSAALHNTVVLCISRDLPFAQKRFCGAEGITGVETLSDFRDGNFGKAYGVAMTDGKLAGLLARAVVVIGGDGAVRYTELIPEIADEPDYGAALSAAGNM
jgi:thiol peroxidase